MGPGQNFLTRVGSDQYFVGSGHGKSQFFQFFPPQDQQKSHRVWSKSTRSKDGSVSYTLRVKSMLGSGPISILRADHFCN